ncbi:efflux RND transporter permease subunit, partial [Acinetobacter baumannii]
IVVIVNLPGADAADMEETVAKPIEDQLQGLDHVRQITSTSTDGSATVIIEFEHGTDAEQSLDRVVREVGSIRDQLPQGIRQILYRRFRTTE